MFTAFHAANWHPLTWLSHAIDYAIWGLNPLGHHLTSIIFHGLNTFLVVIIVMFLVNFAQKDNHISTNSGNNKNISIITIVAGAITGLLFGIHPLHVESVVWISERKDVLYAFFFLLSILSYLKYPSSSPSQRQRILYYSLCLLFFVLSLMSKPMAVTLPAVLLILDFYPLRRLDIRLAFSSHRKVLMEKLPFLGLSFVAIVLTVLAQQEVGAIKPVESTFFEDRILIALKALSFYIYKMIWPIGLAPLYLYPTELSIFKMDNMFSLLFVLSITTYCFFTWEKKKFLSAIWIYYVITLLPVLGIIKIGDQLAADRYTYLPSLGIFLLIGLVIARITETALHKKLKKFYIVVVAVIIVTVLLSIFTIKQIKIWKDSISLWSTEIRLFPKNTHRTHFNLGHALQAKGFIDKAIEQYRLALKLKYDAPEIHNSIGYAYKSKGLIDKAIYHFQFTIKLNPDFQKAHTNLGFIYLSKGMHDNAIQHFKYVLQLIPNDPRAYLNLGIAYKSKGRIEEANKYFRIAQQLNPALFKTKKTQH
jgi:tetratricopeptide (TPR) repeat protein